jgi:transcription termination factor Rho
MVDLLAPIGRGQRCLVAAPPGTGATTLLRELARVIVREDGVVPVIVLVDARPEEVTDWIRAVEVPVHASASDRSSDAHVQLADLALERAKRLVESGQDVVLVIDSISRLARAHELARPRSRRDSADDAEFLAGEAVGVQAAKRWFSAARNTEEGGSLTIIAATRVGAEQTVGPLYGALLDIANMELRLEPELAQSGLYPALDSRRSYNRREAELLDESQLSSLQRLRSSLIPLRAADAWTELAERLRSTQSNDELLRSI